MRARQLGRKKVQRQPVRLKVRALRLECVMVRVQRQDCARVQGQRRYRNQVRVLLQEPVRVPELCPEHAMVRVRRRQPRVKLQARLLCHAKVLVLIQERVEAPEL